MKKLEDFTNLYELLLSSHKKKKKYHIGNKRLHRGEYLLRPFIRDKRFEWRREKTGMIVISKGWTLEIRSGGGGKEKGPTYRPTTETGVIGSTCRSRSPRVCQTGTFGPLSLPDGLKPSRTDMGPGPLSSLVPGVRSDPFPSGWGTSSPSTPYTLSPVPG